MFENTKKLKRKRDKNNDQDIRTGDQSILYCIRGSDEDGEHSLDAGEAFACQGGAGHWQDHAGAGDRGRPGQKAADLEYQIDDKGVLLIDEIDKADLEFPNDLLWEMDQMEFYVQETKETIRAKHRPIVIITSNAEKELPDAFLRRCIFHYIEFPALSQMKEIIHAHFGDIDQEILQQAVLTFYNIRRVQNLSKKPSTSELIDWLRALLAAGVDPSAVSSELPYLGVLIKKDKDYDQVRKSMRR